MEYAIPTEKYIQNLLHYLDYGYKRVNDYKY